ncbi:MAG: putative transcriptional regulator [Paracoccaceae bacterium]|jgi:putative transcriptional regulator
MDLRGSLLVAMPSMADPRFEKTVVLVCSHSEDGTMGLVLNRPSSQLKFKTLLEQLKISSGPNTREIIVHIGGPVERGRGFVLHSPDYQAGTGDTVTLPGGYSMTATLDVIEALAVGEGPKELMFALGYAGWAAGQIEAEISSNDWLTCSACDDIVFGENDSRKWIMALEYMGINPLMLSATSGRA